MRLELPPRPHSLARQESSILKHDRTVEERVFSLIIVAREVLDMKNLLIRFWLHISCWDAVIFLRWVSVGEIYQILVGTGVHFFKWLDQHGFDFWRGGLVRFLPACQAIGVKTSVVLVGEDLVRELRNVFRARNLAYQLWVKVVRALILDHRLFLTVHSYHVDVLTAECRQFHRFPEENQALRLEVFVLTRWHISNY